MNQKELYNAASQARKEGDLDKAIKILTEIIDTFPDSREAENARAVRYDLQEIINSATDASVSPADSLDTANTQKTDESNTVIRASNTSEASQSTADIPKVIVTDIQMPFESMVAFMVKWAIASIPALIILFILFTFAAAIFGGIFGTFF